MKGDVSFVLTDYSQCVIKLQRDTPARENPIQLELTKLNLTGDRLNLTGKLSEMVKSAQQPPKKTVSRVSGSAE